MRIRTRGFGVGVWTLVVGAGLASDGVARADLSERIGVGAELGRGSMLSSYQRDTLALDKAYQTTLFGTYRIDEMLEAQLALRTWWFPRSGDFARATLIGPGLRAWFLDRGPGAAFADANLGLGLNGPDARFMFDVAAGYGFHLGDALDLGPVLRYGQVVAAGSDPGSSMFWSIGVMAIYRLGGRVAARSAAPEPAGAPLPAVEPAPEPARAARPAPTPAASASTEKGHDEDGDGIDDLHDACAETPPGANPDPDRPGCPDSDFDKDGVPDHKDACPGEAPGPRPNPRKPGCPR
jgi:hypothetical protein